MNSDIPSPTDSISASSSEKVSAQGGLHAFNNDDYFNTLVTLADWGDAKSQHNLGAMFLEGLELEQNYAEALKWHTLAAEQDMALAQHDLATMYLEGLGVAEDLEKAAYWFDKAAQQGDAKAQNNLGILFATGQGVVEDLVQAYRWFSLAAAGGMLDALDNKKMAMQDMTPEQRAECQKMEAPSS